MDLLRLPLLVLIDIFKNMNFKEKFLISLLSKRARNTLKLTSAKPHFLFEFSDSLVIYIEQYWFSTHSPAVWKYKWRRRMEKAVEEDYLIEGEVVRLKVNSDGFYARSQTPRNQLLLAGHVLDTFRKPTISVKFSDPTLPSTVSEFINMIHERHLSMKTFTHNIIRSTSQFVPEIVYKCTEVTDFISIHCGYSIRTAETYNSFFSKWMGSNVRLQKLEMLCIEEPEYLMIMEELSKQGTLHQIARFWVKVERRDGSEYFIRKSNNYVQFHTKKSYLEQLKEDELESARRAHDRQLYILWRIRQLLNPQANWMI
uniref:F-box domain-containing protein n=1 Tax=Caenorhabditis tropicalis TaxID=1561998 RepID=A0A1I7UTR5_9PELO